MALFLSKGCQDFKHLQKATYFVYIYKMSKGKFELRQDEWLKEKINATLKLPAVLGLELK